MKLAKITAGILMSAMAVHFSYADNAAVSPMSPAQVAAFDKMIHDYLINHPEVLLEASQVLQKKQQLAMQKEAQAAILQNASDLLKENLAVAGNPKGNVTIVEFFDYACGHCQKMKPVINNLIKKDPNLRVVYREFPIFGKSSEFASRVALAAAMQGKYAPLQDALFGADKHLDEEMILNAAKATGVDMAKLKVDMNSKAVTDMLSANRQLAEKIHLMGTPAFIVMSTPAGQFKADSEPSFVPGSTSEAALQAMIDKAAGKTS